MKNNIHIHVFSYEGDAYILNECIQCARQALPEARVIVIDEKGKECPEELREEILSHGAVWKVSDFPRRGNLWGKDCVTGILREMLSNAVSEDDLLIKLDADSCLMNGEDFRMMAQDGNKVMCACGKYNDRIHGFCYGLRAHAVRKALEVLEATDMPDYVPEDIIVGLAMFNLFPDPELFNIYSPVDRRATWKAYDWWHYPDPRKYRKATVVTTGNAPPFPFTREQRPVMMRYLREAARR